MITSLFSWFRSGLTLFFRLIHSFISLTSKSTKKMLKILKYNNIYLYILFRQLCKQLRLTWRTPFYLKLSSRVLCYIWITWLPKEVSTFHLSHRWHCLLHFQEVELLLNTRSRYSEQVQKIQPWWLCLDWIDTT